MPDFQQVIDAWDRNGRAGAGAIHPLKPDNPQYWELGRGQALQVTEYAEPGAFVIDFGCGIGRLAYPLAAMGYDVLAVDASQAMLARLYEEAPLDPGDLRVLKSDGSTLAEALEGRQADVIVARNVLIHHDYEGVERIVTGLAAAMRPGAHLIADWPLAQAVPHERENWTDVTTWDPEHRRAVADRAGLEPVKLHTIRVGLDAPVWRKRREDPTDA